MNVIVFLIGLITGLLLNRVTNKVLTSLFENGNKSVNILEVLTCAICFLAAYMKFGIGSRFFYTVIFACLLIIVSYIDLGIRIIPNQFIMIILGLGALNVLTGGISLIDSILGMLAGGGILFILALVPNALGGGDIKLMFSVGAILGGQKTLWAIVIAFMAASIISLILLAFKVVRRKDYIPFGPFLALGSFISIMLF